MRTPPGFVPESILFSWDFFYSLFLSLPLINIQDIFTHRNVCIQHSVIRQLILTD